MLFVQGHVFGWISSNWCKDCKLVYFLDCCLHPEYYNIQQPWHDKTSTYMYMLVVSVVLYHWIAWLDAVRHVQQYIILFQAEHDGMMLCLKTWFSWNIQVSCFCIINIFLFGWPQCKQPWKCWTRPLVQSFEWFYGLTE